MKATLILILLFLYSTAGASAQDYRWYSTPNGNGGYNIVIAYDYCAPVVPRQREYDPWARARADYFRYYYGYNNYRYGNYGYQRTLPGAYYRPPAYRPTEYTNPYFK